MEARGPRGCRRLEPEITLPVEAALLAASALPGHIAAALPLLVWPVLSLPALLLAGSVLAALLLLTGLLLPALLALLLLFICHRIFSNCCDGFREDA